MSIFDMMKNLSYTLAYTFFLDRYH